MTTTTLLTKEKQKKRVGASEMRVKDNDRAYHEAWERFRTISSELPKRWKTKKTSLQILREERTR